MIVFSRPPGRRRRAGLPSVRLREAGDVWTSTLRSGSDCPPYNSGKREGAAAAEDGSSSGDDALRRPRKATLRAALQALRTSSRGPCDGPPSRRTSLLAEEPARPSDVSPSYESKYQPGYRIHGAGQLPGTNCRAKPTQLGKINCSRSRALSVTACHQRKNVFGMAHADVKPDFGSINQ